MLPFVRYSSVLVLGQKLGSNEVFVWNVWVALGEEILLESQLPDLQDTSGLTVGDPLVKTGLPLSLELGPGILDGIYVSWQPVLGYKKGNSFCSYFQSLS